MEEKETTRQERYRKNNKEYYNNYYKEYRKTHKVKNYGTCYRKRLEMIKELIKDDMCNENVKYNKIYDICIGKYDEQVI